MNHRFDIAGHVGIAATVLLTVYGQLVLRWQMGSVGPLPSGVAAKLAFLLQQFLNPWILSGLFAAFLASLAWMVVMTRFELGYAYPFTSLAFVFVMTFGALFLGETVSQGKVFGTFLVIAGLVVISRA